MVLNLFQVNVGINLSFGPPVSQFYQNNLACATLILLMATRNPAKKPLDT